MGMLSRMSTIVKSKMNRILDSAEDPRETLDYSYEKQLEMLRNVKRGVVEMVTAKRQIQQQASTVQGNISKLESQARQALEAGSRRQFGVIKIAAEECICRAGHCYRVIDIASHPAERKPIGIVGFELIGGAGNADLMANVAGVEGEANTGLAGDHSVFPCGIKAARGVVAFSIGNIGICET